MRRIAKAVAVASLFVALTTSNIYAVPSKGGSQPSLGSKIVKIIRQIICLDELNWPHP